MSQNCMPFVVDGAVARLFPGTARSLAAGPGLLGRPGAASAVIFDAGMGAGTLDLIGGFWRDEAGTMDWLADFLCNPDMDKTFETLAVPPAAPEEEEEMYSKRDLTTLGSDVIDDY